MILGLDASTKTGAVILDKKGNCLYRKEWNPDMGDWIDRGSVQQRSLRRVLEKYDVELCVMEAYAFRNFNAEVAVTIGTMLRMVLKEFEIPFVTCAPPTLKKFVTGQGRGDKNVIMKAAFKNWGFDDDSDNITDAYCLAQLGRYQLLGKGTEAQKQCLIKVFSAERNKLKKKRRK